MENESQKTSDNRWEQGFTESYFKELVTDDMSDYFTSREIEFLVDQLERSGPDNWLTDKLKAYHYAEFGREGVVEPNKELARQIKKDIKDWVQGLLESR